MGHRQLSRTLALGALLAASGIAANACAQTTARPESTATAKPDSAGATSGGTPSPAVDVEIKRGAMKRLAYLIGNWRGEGWMEVGGQRRAFRGGEVIQEKVGGLALLVEGTFYDRDNPERKEPVHSTLGVISYAPGPSTYRFLTWLANGRTGEHELTIRDNGFEWDLEFPNGTVRYVMERKSNGEWFEVGERSTDDGLTWNKFFEMTLRKEPASPATPARP